MGHTEEEHLRFGTHARTRWTWCRAFAERVQEQAVLLSQLSNQNEQHTHLQLVVGSNRGDTQSAADADNIEAYSTFTGMAAMLATRAVSILPIRSLFATSSSPVAPDLQLVFTLADVQRDYLSQFLQTTQKTAGASSLLLVSRAFLRAARYHFPYYLLTPVQREWFQLAVEHKWVKIAENKMTIFDRKCEKV